MHVLRVKYHQIYKDSDNTLRDADRHEGRISEDYIGEKAPFHLTLGNESDNDCFIDIITDISNCEKKLIRKLKNLIIIC